MSSLDHVHLPVGDLSRARHFYSETIGFNVGYEDETMVYLAGVGLILDAVADRDVIDSGVTVGFTCDDVDAEYMRLKEREAPVGSPPEDRDWGVRSFYLRDPDGHQLEFLQTLD